MNSSWALSPHPGLLVSTASAASCAPIPFATIMYAAHANDSLAFFGYSLMDEAMLRARKASAPPHVAARSALSLPEEEEALLASL